MSIHPDICEFVTSVYTEDFFIKALSKLGAIDRDELENFKDSIIHFGGKYLDMKRMNADRIQPHEQKKRLEKYREALGKTKALYQQIHKHPTTSTKFNSQLLSAVEKNKGESELAEMFYPYVNLEGVIAEELFEKFLDVISDAAHEASKEKNDIDKADLSGEFLKRWMERIVKDWPESAQLQPALGTHNPDYGYSSRSLDVLFDLISPLDANITKKNIETTFRKIPSKPILDQLLAI